MKVKVIRAFGSYRVGDTLEPAALLRGEWVKRGWVAPLVEAKEAAAVVPAQTADTAPARSTRRRKTL